jgi:hypothetical protein
MLLTVQYLGYTLFSIYGIHIGYKAPKKYFMKLKLLLSSIAFTVLFTQLSAQEKKKSSEGGHNLYGTGVGVRFGYNPGLSVKHFISGTAALEGIVQVRYGGFNLTGLYEKHAQAFETEGLHWFYGIGGHVGFYRDWRYRNDKFYPYRDDRRFMLGIDGILGLEYVIKEIPFTVGVDIKPFVEILRPSFGYYDGALTVRYRF